MDDNSAPVLTVQAALLTPPFSTLSYRLPAGFEASFWQPGLLLAVPLGASLRAAVLLERGEASNKENSFSLKEVAWPLEHSPLLSPGYLDYARQLALRQAESPGRALAAMLPAGLRALKGRLRFYAEKAQELELRSISGLEAEERGLLAALWQQGQGVLARAGAHTTEEEWLLLAPPPWPLRPAALKQRAALEFLSARGGRAGRRQLCAALGRGCAAALNALRQKGLLACRRESITEDGPTTGGTEAWLQSYGSALCAPPPFSLNAEQKAALDDFQAVTLSGQAASRLLYGVTGSGKTAVYLELAARCLLQGRSVLLLAPEVALAQKLKGDVEARFPGLPVYFYHGSLSPARREALFRELARASSPALVVGVRSALFLRVNNIGAIVLDEEHDASFRQDERFNYNAKDLAWFLTRQHRALLLLGSATPDIKTFYAVEQGRLKMQTLQERAGGGDLPEVALSILPRGPADRDILTEESALALSDCVQRGEQAVILLNRRGFVPCMYCLECGLVLRCPNCAIALAYHKARERLLCHYCGHSSPFPLPCPACKNLRYLPLGEGTEKLEEQLRAALPAGARVLRLDRDSAGRPGAAEAILRSFSRGEAEVLVGTQMLSKGHHFPGVTLCVAANGDLGLNMLNYNATERVFQLIMQAAGRSGRGEKPGRVIIQSRSPDHYCWEYARRHDYEGFYREELEKRRRSAYPPFVRLALVRVSFPLSWPQGESLLPLLGEKMRAAGSSLGVRVLGPAPSPHPLRGRARRFHCLLKGKDWESVRGVYSAASALPQLSSRLRLSLDIDPADLD